MALNILQKSILRINPNIILNTRVFPEITEDALDFVLSKGYDFRQIPQDRFQSLITNKVFVNELLKLSDQEFVNFVNNNIELMHSIPNKAIELDLYDKVNRIDFTSIDLDSFITLVSKDSRAFIKALKDNSNLIKNLPKDTVIEIEKDYYDEVVQEINRSKLTCFDYPNNITENNRIQKVLIQRDPESFLSVYDSESPNYNSDLDKDLAKLSFKDFILNDLPNNIKYLSQFQVILDQRKSAFDSHEINLIAEEMIAQNIIISDKSYNDLCLNDKLVLNCIIHAETSAQINGLRESTQNFASIYNRYELKTERSEEQISQAEKLASNLRKMNYIYNNDISPNLLLSTPETLLALIDNDPYAVEKIPEYIFERQTVYSDKFKKNVAESLEKGNYLFSPKTPKIFLNMSPKHILESYEMFFDEYEFVPTIDRTYNMDDEEYDALLLKQYYILKEHDPDMLSISEFRDSSNPYIVREALSRGRYKIEAIQDYKFGLYSSENELDIIVKEYMEQHGIKPNNYYGYNKVRTSSRKSNFRKRDFEYRKKYQARFEIRELPEFSAKLLPKDFVIDLNLPLAEYIATINDRDAAFLSAKNNIYTLHYLNDIKFTPEQEKEIAKIYLAGYPQTLLNFLGLSRSLSGIRLPKQIEKNPYIQYELLYKNLQRKSPLDLIDKARYSGNDEIEKLIFDSFYSKHSELSFSSSKFESTNIQIAIRSIQQNPETLRFVSPNIYNNEDLYDLVMEIVKDGKYTIDENTPAKFIGINYRKLKKAGIDVDSIIDVKPEILSSIRERGEFEKFALKYIEDFNDGRISDESFIEKIRSFNGFKLSQSKDIIERIQEICLSRPDLINRIVSANPIIILGDTGRSFLYDLVKSDESQKETSGYKFDFDTPVILLSQSFFDGYMALNHTELVPLLSYSELFSERACEDLRNDLVNKISNHTLELPDKLPVDYHFSSKVFKNMSDTEYSSLIDEIIKDNPYHISIFSGASESQDKILKSKIDKLIKDGTISIDSPNFNLPRFSDLNIFNDYVIQMLQTNPDLINTMQYKLPARTQEEIAFISGILVNNLNSGKPFSPGVIDNSIYISVLLFKDMNYVANLNSSTLEENALIIESFFAKQGIKYSEDIPTPLRKFYREEYKENGYPSDFVFPTPELSYTSLPPFIKEAAPEVRHSFIRQNPQLIASYDVREQLVSDGYILREDDPISFQLDYDLIQSSISQNPSYIYRINPLAMSVIGYVDDHVAETLIRQNYQVGEELPPFLTGSTKLFIYAVKQNPENIKLFDWERMAEHIIDPSDVDPLIDVLLDNDVLLSDKVNPELFKMPRYIYESLKKAENPEDIKRIIDTAYIVDFSKEEKEQFYSKVLELMEEGKYEYNIDSNPELDYSKEIVFSALKQNIENLKVIAPDTRLFTLEEQMAIYELYTDHKELFEKNPELLKVVRGNPYVIIDRALNDVKHFDNYSFEGVHIPPEYIDKVVKVLLESGYKVSENTPRFLLLDSAFLAQYIKQNESTEGIPQKYVANLFSIDKLSENPDLSNVYKYCSHIKSPLSSYTFIWGIDLTIELVERFGPLIRYLDPCVKYTIKSAKDDLEMFFQENPDMETQQLIQFFIILGKEVSEQIFEEYKDLAFSDEFIKYAYSKNPELLFQYKGSSEELLILAKDVDPTDSYLSIENFAESNTLLSALIEEKGPDFIRYYRGTSEELIELSLKKGLFVEKDDKYISDILNANELLRKSDLSIKYLIEHYSPNYIEQYLSDTPEVFQEALENGYEVTYRNLLKYGLYCSDEMVEVGIKNDPYCHGFRYFKYSDTDKLKILQTIMGEDVYYSIFDPQNVGKDVSNPDKRTKTEQDFLNLSTVVDNEEEGARFLKLADNKLIQKIGFDKWVKVVKYLFENPNLEFLIDAIEQDKIEELVEFQDLIGPYIDDNQALGVNKFLTITRFYMQKSDFCNELLKQVESGKELSNIEVVNLQTIIYRESSVAQFYTPDNLKDLISFEKNNLELNRSKDALLTFIFNIDEKEATNILNKYINSKTIAQIHSRAIRDNNEKLVVESDFMGIAVDLIENIKYNYTNQYINAIIDSILKMPDESIIKLRKLFGNIKELIRHFYEIEAQEEMIDLDKLKQDSNLTKEYPGKEEGTTVKVIDVSNIRHTLYAHVYSGATIADFFNTAKGRVTICVSPETDKYEMFFHSDDADNAPRFGFTKLATGSFVGSAPSNMGSNSHIAKNNYEVRNVDELYDQRSIRESFSRVADTYPETLLYRQDLIPTCLIINHLPPNDYQLQLQSELQAETRKIPGHEKDEIVFVLTQGSGHRIFDYQIDKQTPAEREDISEKQRFIQDLRKEFFGLSENQGEISSKQSFVRTIVENDTPKKISSYTIINGELYNIVDEESKELAAIKLASKLESIVHKETPEAMLDVRQIGSHIAKKAPTDSRILWHLTRSSGSLSPKANSILLKEFLVDHLMCNYTVGNNAFSLSSDNSIMSTGYKKPLEHASDFISPMGRPYTAMSYYYFDFDEKMNKDSDSQNNVYRKMFEAYINSSDKEDVIPPEAFEDMRRAAEEFSNMPTEEYMKMFSEILNQETDGEMRSQKELLIKARKENIVQDTETFIQRLEKQRTQEHTIEEIDSPETVALINDIHGNLSALETLLDKCEELGKKDVFILGDMIGFGAQSNECLSLIRERAGKLNIRCILGNHELYSLMGNDSFTGLSQKEQSLTSDIRKDISGPNREFLEELPLTRKVKIGGKMVEFTHFPILDGFVKDSDIYLPHESGFYQTSSGKSAAYVIYGHEHRTESTTGNQVGTIDVQKNGDVTFINLPSSGCVHGERTTLTFLDQETTKEMDDKTGEEITKKELVANVVALYYDKERNDKAIRETNNPYPSHFGTKLNPDEGER